MIYQHIRELPVHVKEYLSEASQERFMDAFNRFITKGCDRGSAFQLAWETLKLNDNAFQNRKV